MSIVNDNWYETFFQGLNCELWQKAISPDRTKQEVDFLLSELQLQQGDSVLDIPCGFGRHSIELSKRGMDVTGIDISDTFISLLKQSTKSGNLSIQAICADILSINLNQKFSGAICLGNSFGYFTFDKMNLFVGKVAAALEKGSRFIINSAMIAESILPNFPRNKFYTVDNIQMNITNTYDVAESAMISNIAYDKEGVAEEYSFKHYIFTLGEVKRLLGSHGLVTVAAYNSPNKNEYNLGDQEVYIVAEKT